MTTETDRENDRADTPNQRPGQRVGQTSAPASPHPWDGARKSGGGVAGDKPLKGLVPPLAPPYPCGSDFEAAKTEGGTNFCPTLAAPPSPAPEPPPFRILIDTREQTPLPFSRIVPTRRATLYPGDYSIEGLTHLFAVERKSLPDLIGSLIGHKPLADGSRRYNRDRLVEELLAMRRHRFRCVAVTAPRRAVENHAYQSRLPPENVIGMVASIEAHTGVQFKFFADPDEAARWIAAEALHFWRLVHGLSSLRPKVRAERLALRLPSCPPPPPQVATAKTAILA